MKAAFAYGMVLVVVTTLVAGEENPSTLLAKLVCPDRVSSVAFSSDGKLLAAGYGWRSQGGLMVWNVSDGTIAHSWKSAKQDVKTRAIRRVAFSSDGKLLAAATGEGDLQLWSLDNWGPPKVIRANAGPPSGLAFNAESDLLALSGEKAVIIYDLKTEKQQQVFVSPNPMVQPMSAGFSSEGRTLLVCENGSLKFWDADANRSIRSRKRMSRGNICVVSPKSTYTVTGGGPVYGPKLVEIWNQAEDHPIAQLAQFRDGVFAAAIDRAESILALGGGDPDTGGNLSLWSLDTKKEIGAVSVGELPIESLAFSPSAEVLAAGSGGSEVLLLSVEQVRGSKLPPDREEVDHVRLSTPVVEAWRQIPVGSPVYVLDDVVAQKDWLKRALIQRIDFQTGVWNIWNEHGYTVFRICPYMSKDSPQPQVYQGIVLKVKGTLSVKDLAAAIQSRTPTVTIDEYDVFGGDNVSIQRYSRPRDPGMPGP